MSAQIARKVSDIESTLLLSRTVRNLLANSYYQTSHKEVGVAGFLRATLNTSVSSTAASVARSVFGSESVASALPSLSGDQVVGQLSAPDVDLSEGLWQALSDASALRLQTNGNDEFAGLRYVLFVMFTANDGALSSDIEDIFKATGADRGYAKDSIAKFCVEAREPPEKRTEWEKILTSVGLEAFMSSWPDDSSTHPPRDPTIPLLQPDDPWDEEVRDQSGAGSEAIAFADMIVAKEFHPPLAVGIFGDWGSGKSFFMRQLYEAVSNNRLRYARVGEVGGINFCQDVVQIRFNAWHYAEANLWASLVDHIFTSLNQWTTANDTAESADRLFEQLSTARRLTIEAAEDLVRSRAEREAAATKLKIAENDLTEKRATLQKAPSIYFSAALGNILDDADGKNKVLKAAQDVGLGTLWTSAREFETASSVLDGELNNFSLFRSGLIRFFAKPLVIAIVVTATLALPPALIWVTREFEPAEKFGTVVAGLIAPIAVAMSWAARKTDEAISTVRKFRNNLSAAIERAAANERAVLESNASEVVAAEARVVAAAETMRLTNERATEASRAYNDENGRAKLLRFVRDRVANGDYAKQLSFVSTVRRDFEELSRLMTSAGTPAREAERSQSAHKKRVDELIKHNELFLSEDEKGKLLETSTGNRDTPKLFERIILYVDDLDRCSTEQVVTVLQAIHLMLAFRLFVVFVAVDVRWLREALARKYVGQLATKDGQAEATVSDYLEKIFQIPFWVRPLGPDVTRSLLQDRMGPIFESGDIEVLANITQISERRAILGERPIEHDVSPSSERPDGRPSARSLRLTDLERRCIESIAEGLDGLPRRTLRFLNTYCLLKSCLGPQEQTYLEQQSYPALVVLVALAVILEEDFPTIVANISKIDGTEHESYSYLDGPYKVSPSAKDRALLCLKLASYPRHSDLSRYAQLAGRFSFHRAHEK